MGGAMLSKSLIQFSVDRLGCVPSLLFDLSNEDNCDLLQKVQCSPRPSSRPLLTHASTRDSWTLTGKSGSVSCGITTPFSWVWFAQGFVCAFQESVSPVLCMFWWLYGGLVVTSPKRVYAIPRSAAPRAPVPAAGHC